VPPTPPQKLKNRVRGEAAFKLLIQNLNFQCGYSDMPALWAQSKFVAVHRLRHFGWQTQSAIETMVHRGVKSIYP
jgi:hypothetical protein